MCHVMKPLAIAAGLNSLIFVVETVGGFVGHSNSLIMDGIHNFSDELALVCLYLAYLLPIKMSKNLQRIANTLNSLGLLTISGIIVWQSIERILNPHPIMGSLSLVAGLFAIFANWFVARVLYPVRGQNAAIKLAYLHNLGDVYVSMAPVLAGIFLMVTGKSFFDSIIAITIGIWFIFSTLREILTSYNQLIWPENAVCQHDIKIQIQTASSLQ